MTCAERGRSRRAGLDPCLSGGWLGATFVLLLVAQRVDLDLTQHWWLLAMPLLAALLLNVTLLEPYRRRRQRRS